VIVITEHDSLGRGPVPVRILAGVGANVLMRSPLWTRAVLRASLQERCRATIGPDGVLCALLQSSKSSASRSKVAKQLIFKTLGMRSGVPRSSN
jgi:hypothetical protein